MGYLSEGLPSGMSADVFEGRPLTEADCTCLVGEGCDEEGDPGCAYCQELDSEWPCPADDGRKTPNSEGGV